MIVQAHPLRRALPLFLLAGLCLSSLDATAKYLVRDHPLLLVVWARYAGQMIVVTPFAWHRAGGGFWRTRNLRMQLLRSSFLLAATVGFFAGLRYLPLAEASSITFMAPMVVVALSLPVLGERPTRPRIVASLIGFAGILILVRPGSAVMHPAVVFLLIAAVSNALYQLYTRKLRDENPHVMLFYSALVGAVGLTLALPFLLEATRVTLHDGALLMLSGVFAGMGHGLMISAYAKAPAALLAPFTYLQVLWATLFGAVIFGQHPDALSALGMAVIVASGVMLALWERRRARLRVGSCSRCGSAGARGSCRPCATLAPQPCRTRHVDEGRVHMMKPMLGIACALAIAVTLGACDRQSAQTKAATEQAKESASKAGDALKKAAEATGAAAKDAAKATIDAARDASQQANEAAKQAVDKASPEVKETLSKAADATKEAADKAAAATREAAEKAKQKANEAADKAKNATK